MNHMLKVVRLAVMFSAPIIISLPGILSNIGWWVNC